MQMRSEDGAATLIVKPNVGCSKVQAMAGWSCCVDLDLMGVLQTFVQQQRKKKKNDGMIIWDQGNAGQVDEFELQEVLAMIDETIDLLEVDIDVCA
jgi:hypothetical protein